MKKMTMKAVVTTIIAVILWMLTVGIDVPFFDNRVVVFGALVTSVVSVVLWAICLMKKLESKLSNYVYFAIGDFVLMLIVLLYSIYDILTNKNFLGGLAGICLLIYIEPVLLIFEVSAIIAYFRKKKLVISN